MSEYLDKLFAEMEVSGTAPRIAAKQKRKSNSSQAVLTVKEAAEGSPYSYEKDGKKYLAEYIGLVGAPEAQPADPNFPTGQMSYDTFPYGAMSEAPEPTKYPVLPEKYVSPVDERTYYWSGKVPEMPKVRSERLPTTGLIEPPYTDYLLPQRPNIDWDEEAKKDTEEAAVVPGDVGVSYAGGLSDYAIDPGQVRSATNAYAPDQSIPAEVDPMQFMSANGLLPREPLDLSGVQPESEDEAIPTWARVALGLADAFRISGTRGGLFPETAVADKNARIGGTTSELIDNMKKEAELDKAIRANDLARAKVLSQAAMSETDPARKAEYGKAIKRLLPRETQGLDDITAAGMFTGDDKIALEREKQKGRMDLQTLKNLAALDQLSVKGAQASGLEDQKSQNRIEEMRAKYAELSNLESQKSALRHLELEKKFGHDIAMQQLKNEGMLARQQLTANKVGKVRGQTGAPTPEEMNKIGTRTAVDVLKELKNLNEEAGRWAETSNPSEHTWWGRHVSYPHRDWGADYAAGTSASHAYMKFENLLKQVVQDQLRKIYGSQFTQEEGERFFRSMGLDPIAAPEERWDLAMAALNDLRLKHGYDIVDPTTLREIPNTAYKVPLESMKPGQSQVINGVIITKNSD